MFLLSLHYYGLQETSFDDLHVSQCETVSRADSIFDAMPNERLDNMAEHSVGKDTHGIEIHIHIYSQQRYVSNMSLQAYSGSFSNGIYSVMPKSWEIVPVSLSTKSASDTNASNGFFG